MPSWSSKARKSDFLAFARVRGHADDGSALDADADWLGTFYLSANRLAHLYFLTVIAEVPAWLVNLYFVGDCEQSGPETVADWEATLQEVRTVLALPEEHLLAPRVITLFLPAGSSAR